jgi:hypothetical protein
MHDDLLFLYLHLREQLDAAYRSANWDSQLIDRSTSDMLSVERSLAREGVTPEDPCGTPTLRSAGATHRLTT